MLGRVAVMGLLIGMAGCSDEPNAHQQSALQGGKQLYLHYCADCHHDSGGADLLRGIPAIKFTQRSETEIVAWIRGDELHADDRQMPSYRDMPDVEAYQIARYLKDELWEP